MGSSSPGDRTDSNDPGEAAPVQRPRLSAPRSPRPSPRPQARAFNCVGVTPSSAATLPCVAPGSDSRATTVPYIPAKIAASSALSSLPSRSVFNLPPGRQRALLSQPLIPTALIIDLKSHSDHDRLAGVCSRLATSLDDGRNLRRRVREPILAEVLPDVLDRVQLGRAMAAG